MTEKQLTLAHSLTTACCGDVRLHRILPLLDDNESYRERSIGAPLKFAIDQGDLLKWHAILTGFPEDGIRVSDALLLAHTDCLAVNTNAYFATLREKRHRLPGTLEGDF